jgi:type I restriction enzyme S subunit
LEHWTQTGHYWSQIRSASIQATIENVSAERYKELVVPVAPAETHPELVERLDHARQSVAAIKVRIERQMAAMIEHRQALITAAVTGELGVPEAVA